MEMFPIIIVLGILLVAGIAIFGFLQAWKRRLALAAWPHVTASEFGPRLKLFYSCPVR